MAQQPPESTGTIQCVLFPAPQVLPSLPLFLEEGGCLKDVTLFGCVVGTVQVCSIEVLQAALQGPVWTKLRSEWSDLKPVIQACNWRGGGFAPAMFGREIPAAWVSREKLLPRKAGSLLKSRETCPCICGR